MAGVAGKERFKAHGSFGTKRGYKDRQRQLLLQRQQDRRRDMADRVRRLVEDDVEGMYDALVLLFSFVSC